MDNAEIVLGPPGTGKTTTLLNIVDEELARGTRPDRIGYLSFTKKAVNEAAGRACERFSRDREDFPYFRTLHSLCFRMLGLGSADVFEGKRMQEFAAYAGVRISGRWSDDGSLFGFDTGDRILFMENLARVRGIDVKQQFNSDNDGMLWYRVEPVIKALHQFKEDNNLVDYTDMLLETVKRGATPRLDVLVVDEAQDLSWAQWQVVYMMARGCRRVVVAGDDDQAIYEWAGSDLATFLQMKGDVRVLNQSWRVPRTIQAQAMRPLSKVKRRREKEWTARDEEGDVETKRIFGDCDLTGEEILVLARNDYVLRDQVEPWLRRGGVIFEKHGFPAVKQSIIDAVVYWERLRRGERVTGLEARLVYDKMESIKAVARGFKALPAVGDEDEVSLGDLKKSHGLLTDLVWHEALGRIPPQDRDYMLTALRRGEKLLRKPRVRISTIHGSKGGEADHVILLTEMAARTYAEMRVAPEAEARVWYVGATRARKKLTIVRTTNIRRCPWL